MAITVTDIEQKEFAYKGAGYDPDDVDQFLDQICDEMDAMTERIETLQRELADARREAEAAANAVRPVEAPVVQPVQSEPEVSKTSSALESILVNAQKLSDEAIENAQRKADDLVKQAQDKAEGIVENAKEEKTSLEKEIETLHAAAADYKQRFAELLSAQKDLLGDSAALFE